MMDTIITTDNDIRQVLDRSPMFQLQVKCMALIRMIEERDREIALLREQIGRETPEYARNGSESNVEAI